LEDCTDCEAQGKGRVVFQSAFLRYLGDYAREHAQRASELMFQSAFLRYLGDYDPRRDSPHRITSSFQSAFLRYLGDYWIALLVRSIKKVSIRFSAVLGGLHGIATVETSRATFQSAFLRYLGDYGWSRRSLASGPMGFNPLFCGTWGITAVITSSSLFAVSGFNPLFCGTWGITVSRWSGPSAPAGFNPLFCGTWGITWPSRTRR